MLAGATREGGGGASRGEEPVLSGEGARWEEATLLLHEASWCGDGGGNITAPLGIFNTLSCPDCVINVIGVSLSEPHISEYYGRRQCLLSLDIATYVDTVGRVDHLVIYLYLQLPKWATPLNDSFRLIER